MTLTVEKMLSDILTKLETIEARLDEIEARLDYLAENDEEILEKLSNLSLPGADYSIHEEL